MTLWNQAYHIKGSSALKIIQLSNNKMFKVGDEDFFFFDRYIDVIECAAIIGFKRYNDPEKYQEALRNYIDEDKESDIEVPIKTILKESKKLKFLFRVIVLNEIVSGKTLKEKTDGAFREGDGTPAMAFNETLFNNFMKLGVDIIYNCVIGVKDAPSCLDIMADILELKINE